MTEFDAWSAPFDAAKTVQNLGENAVIMGQSWDALLSDLMVNGLPSMTEKSSMTISAVYACVSLIGGAIAALPVQIYKRDLKTGERDQLHDDPLWWVLNEEMSPRWMAAHGWEFLVFCLLLLGDCFAVIRRDGGGNIRRLIPLHPDRVRVIVDTMTDRLVYVVEPEALGYGAAPPREIIDQDDMIHVAGLGFDGIRGRSVMRHALSTTGAVSLATQDYAARFFANSARPDYALGTEQKLTPDAITRMRDQIEEKYAGKNSHRPMVLDGGLKIMPVSLPLEDVQLLTTRQFQIEEIARIYGVPPFMIGHNEKTTSWGSGVEAMGVGFIRFTLRPWLNKFENELNRKAFRSATKVATFDTADLERADLKSLFDSYRVALGRAGEQPFMHVDEVRAKLSLNKRDDLSVNQGASIYAPPQSA